MDERCHRDKMAFCISGTLLEALRKAKGKRSRVSAGVRFFNLAPRLAGRGRNSRKRISGEGRGTALALDSAFADGPAPHPNPLPASAGLGRTLTPQRRRHLHQPPHWNVISRHLEMSEPRPEEMVMQPRTFCAVLSLAQIA